MRHRRLSIRPLALAALAFAGLDGAAMPQAPQKPATVEDARAFLADAEEKLLALSTNASRASWVQSTFITDDTEILAAQANEKLIAATGGVREADDALLRPRASAATSRGSSTFSRTRSRSPRRQIRRRARS